MKPQVSHTGAVLCAIAGFTCFVLCDSAIKLVGGTKVPNFEVLAFLGVFMCVFMLLYASCRGDVRGLWPERPRRLVIRSCLDVGNNLCVVIALRHLSLTLFYILIFTSPMLVALLGRLYLEERLVWGKVAALVTGFAGVVVAVYPSRSTGHSAVIGLAACIVCVTCFSIAVVWTREISQTERPESITFLSGLVTGIVGVAGTASHFASVDARQVGLFVAMGLLGTIGSIFTYTALRYTTAATVSQYHYTQLVSGAIVAYFLFNERPTLSMLAGATLIVAAGLYIATSGPDETDRGVL